MKGILCGIKPNVSRNSAFNAAVWGVRSGLTVYSFGLNMENNVLIESKLELPELLCLTHRKELKA